MGFHLRFMIIDVKYYFFIILKIYHINVPSNNVVKQVDIGIRFPKTKQLSPLEGTFPVNPWTQWIFTFKNSSLHWKVLIFERRISLISLISLSDLFVKFDLLLSCRPLDSNYLTTIMTDLSKDWAIFLLQIIVRWS